MKNFSTHICFVSNETDANLLPLIDSDLSPNKVLLFTSEKMQTRAKWLSEAMRQVNGKLIEFKIIDVVNAYDINSIEQTLEKVTYDNIDDTDDIIVNITGGTKAMTIAAFDFCTKCKIPFFYVDIDSISAHFHPVGSTTVSEVKKLNHDYLKFERYLSAHGYQITDVDNSTGIISDEEDRFIQNLLDKCFYAVPALNAIAVKAKESKKLQAQFDNYESFSGILDIIDTNNWGLLSNDNKEITFTSEKHIRFVSGIWLEKHVARVLRDILKSTTIYQGLSVKTEKFPNELDIAFFHNEKLHIIEVKTCRFDKRDNSNQDYIHKLQNISRELGGLTTKKCFLSLFPVTKQMKNRASELNIAIIDNYMAKNNLKASLLKWLNG